MGASAALNIHERQQCSIGDMLVALQIAAGISSNLFVTINTLSSTAGCREPMSRKSDVALLVTASSLFRRTTKCFVIK